MPRLKELPVSAIRIIANHPPIDQAHLDKIKESIELNARLHNGYDGLLTPVKVYITRDEGGRTTSYWALDSSYCVVAFQILGKDRIQCEVYDEKELLSWEHANLIRIDSNLIRREIDIIERGELLAERDEILANLGLRTKLGTNQYTGRGRGSATVADPKTKTSAELAQEAGISERTLYASKQIASTLTPEVKQAVRDAGLAHNTRDLIRIAQAGNNKRDQMTTLNQIWKEREQKAAARDRGGRSGSSSRDSKSNVVPLRSGKQSPSVSVVTGEWWQLSLKHDLWCGSTSGGTFANYAPEAALAIAPILLLDTDRVIWSHDWLLEKADIVAVPVIPRAIVPFIEVKQMPGYQAAFHCWLYNGNKPENTITIFLFSKMMNEINVPKTPPKIYSQRDLFNLLVSSYSRNGDRIICPFIQDDSLLQVADQMGRWCYMGSDQSENCSQVVMGWQNRTGKPAKRVEKRAVAVG